MIRGGLPSVQWAQLPSVSIRTINHSPSFSKTTFETSFCAGADIAGENDPPQRTASTKTSPHHWRAIDLRQTSIVFRQMSYIQSLLGPIDFES
jgi:hypothetical protein